VTAFLVFIYLPEACEYFVCFGGHISNRELTPEIIQINNNSEAGNKMPPHSVISIHIVKAENDKIYIMGR
jgi:hypothetical protein